jgi:hypothetical protein
MDDVQICPSKSNRLGIISIPGLTIIPKRWIPKIWSKFLGKLSRKKRDQSPSNSLA